MGGTAKSISPAVGIRKSSAELKALVHKHTHKIENGITHKEREMAIFDLMDVLLSNSDHISPKAVQSMAAALADRDERVSVTADLALTVLVKDHPKKVFPLIAKEEAKAKGKHAKKISETIRSIYSLSSFKERVKLRDLGLKFRQEPIKPKKVRGAPQRVRRVA
jgi:hypothetical protein